MQAQNKKHTTTSQLSLCYSIYAGPREHIQKVYTDQELEKFLLDYCVGLDCPIPKLNIYQLDPDEICHIHPGNEMYFLVNLERNSKGVVRSFNKNGWRQKRTLESGMSSLEKVGAQRRARHTGGRPKPADEGGRAILRKESGRVSTCGLRDERR
jgi:hypothetical protein